ncbi:hypothetical protein Hte_011701 [Hypoxylon texense]
MDSSSGVGKVMGKVMECLHSIHQEDVVHDGVRWANVLSNPATGQVMIVDFERASIVELARRPLGPLVLNKRPWDYERDEKRRARDQRLNKAGFQDDISAAVAVFFGSGVNGYASH